MTTKTIKDQNFDRNKMIDNLLMQFVKESYGWLETNQCSEVSILERAAHKQRYCQFEIVEIQKKMRNFGAN